MKIAVYNEFFGENCAERELAERIRLAAKNLGWEAVEVASSLEVKHLNPDFVLALHYKTAKLTEFPTYGCMWNPPIFFEQYDTGMKRELPKRNILSYDAYLSSSQPINIWLKDILYGTNKKYFIAPFYTSCHRTSYKKPCLDNPELVYVGTNWDGSRFEELFKSLDTKDYMAIYGPRNAWRYLNNSYKGSLPFDGVSILDTLNQAGVGLCLHKEEHRQAAVPSMRIFEIVASGAVAICEEHPFIREAFGDNVFYINSDLNPWQKAAQISKYISWIRNNQKEALAMSAQAHQIFVEKYSLDKLLLEIVPEHQKLIREKGFIKQLPICKDREKKVEIIVRVGDRDANIVQRSLDSIASQTYENIGVILVKYKPLKYLDDLLMKYDGKFSIKIIDTEYTGFRSTQLIAGINAVSSEYFGILDDDDLIHPNHVHSLVYLLNKYHDVGLAYSGSIRVWEASKQDKFASKQNFLEEVAELSYFEPFDINKILCLNNFITSNSFIARSSLIDEKLQQDPLLKVAEDMFILINFCSQTKFAFSYEVTSEFYWRDCQKDNSTFESLDIWEESAKRIRNMFWKKEFALTRYISSPTEVSSEHTYSNQNSNLEVLESRLKEANQVIEAIQTSKFWKLRTAWFKLRKALRIPTKEQLL